MKIEGKVALVTGAGYGIGRGISRRLAEAGASVVVDDVHGHHGRETVQIIEAAGGTAAFVEADVTRDDEVERMIGFTKDSFGALDILVNNAGIGMNGVIPGTPPEVWSQVLHVFLRQYMLGTQLALRAMADRGGVIVNIASSAGIGFGGQAWPEYAAAKAGVVRFTACMAPQKESANVRVNCICPGWVATENVKASIRGLSGEEERKRDIPDPMLTPEDIGTAVIHFVQDDSLFGRVMLYYEPSKCRLIPAGLDLFELSEEVSL
jgi:NAD(P)-dependent dehydrogenase (short-subunit alcohol dehydrogenase family)